MLWLLRPSGGVVGPTNILRTGRRSLMVSNAPAELLYPDDQREDEGQEDENEGQEAGNHHQFEAGKGPRRAAGQPQVRNVIGGHHGGGRHTGAGRLAVKHEAAGAFLLLLPWGQAGA